MISSWFMIRVVKNVKIGEGIENLGDVVGNDYRISKCKGFEMRMIST